MKANLISISRITIPEFVERPTNVVADARDRASIERHGIQQPLVLVADGAALLLAKGLRRLRIARSLGIAKVPALVYTPPRGAVVADFVRELRLALDVHRQDLLASQKCSLIETLKERFSMNNVQVANYISCDADTITNHLAVKTYIPPVVEALDAGRLTMQHARVFTGMTPEGQEMVWEVHRDDLEHGTGAKLHREIRQTYPPDKFPQFFRDPKLVKQRLERVSGKRKSAARVSLTHSEKRRLSASLELKAIELREGAEEEKRLKAEIAAAIAPVAGIMRSPKLLSLVPAEMKDELDRFAEIFI